MKIDVRIPADPADFETTESKTALPPVQFTIQPSTTILTNTFTIQDREFPAQRAPTVAYRIYFLPETFAGSNASATVRRAGSRVASLVTEVQAPGRGTVLSVSDYQYFGQPGWYYCVGVNRRGLEAPAEHMVKA